MLLREASACKLYLIFSLPAHITSETLHKREVFVNSLEIALNIRAE